VDKLDAIDMFVGENYHAARTHVATDRPQRLPRTSAA
jgi:hypothetical protein